MQDSKIQVIESWVKRQWITRQIAYNLIRKEKETDQAVISMRKAACGSCPYNDGVVCKKCGCILEVKISSRTNWNPAKNRIEITHCPQGKWGDAEISSLYSLTV